ncbi:PLP-dependent aminotransferase family protein [Rothia kristinae]|nr:PLP-dependent aminotransferase family protein [Rothia kristinae]
MPTQLVEQIRELVAVGTLRPGDALPSTRALAARLSISRGSVTTAYDQLTGEGFLIADRGGTRITPELPALPPRPRGTTPDTPRRSVPAASGVAAAAGPGTAVAADPGENAAGGPGVHAETGPAAEATTAPEARTEAASALRYDLRPGTPDVSALTTTAWRAAWRAAAAQPSLGHPPQGSAALRRELAEHLRIGRSVPADPEDLLVTGGARDGLRLLLTVLAQRLGRALTVAVEDPGYPSLHRVPAALGHRVVPVPLDAQGLDPAHLEKGPARPDVVLVTPSHQYPLGASMPAARRAELLAWASSTRPCWWRTTTTPSCATSGTRCRPWPRWTPPATAPGTGSRPSAPSPRPSPRAWAWGSCSCRPSCAGGCWPTSATPRPGLRDRAGRDDGLPRRGRAASAHRPDAPGVPATPRPAGPGPRPGSAAAGGAGAAHGRRAAHRRGAARRAGHRGGAPPRRRRRAAGGGGSPG